MARTSRTGNTDRYGTIFIEDDVVISKSRGDGLKVDIDAPTYSWHDIIGDITPKTTGANSPTLGAFIGGAYRSWFYAAGDLNWCLYHMPHDYAPRTDIFLHLHWAHNGTAISGQLVNTYGISYAKGHNQAIFSAEVAPVLTVSTPNISTIPQYRHRIDEIQISSLAPSASQLNSALLEPDGLILCGVTATEIPSITGGSTNKPAFFTLDLHYQSTGIGTKQRVPDFYT